MDGVDAYYDETEATIKTQPFEKESLGSKALDFVAVLLRMNDFLLLTQEKVSSTFREDAAQAIRKAIGDRATIRENEPVNTELHDVTPDMILETHDRAPVAVFFGNTSTRVNDAIFLYFRVHHEVKAEVSIVALLETDHSVSAEIRRRATNRLDALPVFRDDEIAAIERIGREAIGSAAIH